MPTTFNHARSSSRKPDACDDAKAADAEWFAANPDRQYRMRPFITGELPVDAPWVVVKQIARGVRVRLPVDFPPGFYVESSEQVARAIFRGITGQP